MRSLLLLLLAVPVVFADEPTSIVVPNATTDRAAIERAVLDYAESYYEAKPEYVERSLSRDLAKIGWWRDAEGTYRERPMDYAGFMEMVEWVVENGKPEPGPKDVVILDAMDRTALVKLTGSWGIDYMQLTKESGRWQTRHVVWQSLPPERSGAEQERDEQAVKAAANDYLVALYETKPELIERSVHPDLVKHGYWRNDDGTWRTMPMTHTQLRDLAANWNASGWLADDAPSAIEVIEVMDRVACAKLTAHWGVDYMHLVKVDDRWQILQILWQSAPETSES